MIKRFAIMKKTKAEDARPTRLYSGIKRIRDIMERFPKKFAKLGNLDDYEIREYRLELRKVHPVVLVPEAEAPPVVETPTEVIPPVVEATTPTEVVPSVVEASVEVVPPTVVDVPTEVPPPVV